MARKGWEALSPGYRATLEKGGITRAAYERGDSLKKARRHDKTPEHPPRDLSKIAKQFPEYVRTRRNLENEVEQRKRALWAGFPKYNPITARRNLERQAPSRQVMEKVLQMSLEELRDAFNSDPKTFSFLGYK